MALSQRYRLLAPLALVGATAIALTGCAEATPGEGGGDGDVKGATVRISGGITGTEADDLNESFAAFVEETGIKVEYTGDKSFEGNIVTRLRTFEGRDVIAPQPAIAGTYEDRLFPFEVTFDLADVAPGDYVVISRTDDPSGEGRFDTDTRRITVVD